MESSYEVRINTYFSRYDYFLTDDESYGPNLQVWEQSCEEAFREISLGNFEDAEILISVVIRGINRGRKSNWYGWSLGQIKDALYLLVRSLRLVAMLDEFLSSSDEYPARGLLHADIMEHIVSQLDFFGLKAPELLGVSYATKSMAYYIAGRDNANYYKSALEAISISNQLGVPKYANFLLTRGLVIMFGLTNNAPLFRKYGKKAYAFVESDGVVGGSLAKVAVLEGMARASKELLNGGFTLAQIGGFTPKGCLSDAKNYVDEKSQFGLARIARSKLLISLKDRKNSRDNLIDIVNRELPVLISLGATHLIEEVMKTISKIGLDTNSIRSIDERGKLHMKMDLSKYKEFDVFLSHNSRDKDQVTNIAKFLQRRGFNPWLDKWALKAGQRWVPELEAIMNNVECAFVFFGSSGLGPWHKLEMESVLIRFVDKGCKVVPVILSGVNEDFELPLFFRGTVSIDLRKDEPNPYTEMISVLE